MHVAANAPNPGMLSIDTIPQDACFSNARCNLHVTDCLFLYLEVFF